MKILSRDDFAKMPEGTLFSYGDKWCFKDLLVKGDTLEGNRDWGERSLLTVGIEAGDEEALLETGISCQLNRDYGRHGLFDDDLVFYVFEDDDLVELSNIIAYARMKIGP